ncbi:MAG: outer membrane beta-barrel protein [Bacteroidales bacterium]
MKKFLVFVLSILVINTFAQVVNEDTKRKFTFGLDVFTDIWQDVPEGVSPKTINPGVNVFGSYNYMLGKSNFSFSPGIGIGVHNMLNESFLRTQGDQTYFIQITDTMPDLAYNKSKFVATYFDIPVELRFKSKSEFRFALGFKFGFLIKAHTKYKGDDFIGGNYYKVIYKKARIEHIEKNRYGFTARIGYKWLNLWGYYQLSSLFLFGNGPQMYPISIGITVIPF